jgi:hypothetical protein
MDVLIGHTGFVGSNLARQHTFDAAYRSSTIDSLRGGEADLIVCAGVQAKKWWANLNPDADWEGIQRLLTVLETVRAKRFVLISTVDVYTTPSGVTEEDPCAPDGNHAYGSHRLAVERFVADRFSNHCILRLPGLFGDGIKKNVIHDMLNRHELEKINPAGVFQYYFLDWLWADIQRADDLGLKVLNLATEPLGTETIRARFFPELTLGPESTFKATYDMGTRHATDWGNPGSSYLYDRSAVLAGLETFIERWRSQQTTP